MQVRAAALPLLLAVALTACGAASKAAGTQTPAPTTSTSTVTKDASYVDVIAMNDALDTFDLGCTSGRISVDAAPSEVGVTSQGRCTLSGTGGETVLGTYDTRAHAAAAATNLCQLSAGTAIKLNLVVGPNWLANASDELAAQQINGALGGELDTCSA